MTTLVQARTELQARGYGRFLATRLTTWLNDAKEQFEDYGFDWPWLLATATGAAPLTVADLRRVKYVVDSTNGQSLRKLTQAEVVELVDVDLTTTSAPLAWYLTSDTGLAVYPVQASSLSVRYVKFSPPLSGDSDTPLIPSRYHGCWVDLAEVHALRYGVKDMTTAAALEQAAMSRVVNIAGVYRMQDQPEIDEQFLVGTALDD